MKDEIVSLDTEEVYYFKAIPVIGAGLTVGQMLEEAFQWTSSLEASRNILLPYRLLSPPEEREGGGQW